MTMSTDQDAAERVAATFSECPKAPPFYPFKSGGHRWLVDQGVCQLCGAKYPYADGVSEDGTKR